MQKRRRNDEKRDRQREGEEMKSKRRRRREREKTATYLTFRIATDITEGTFSSALTTVQLGREKYGLIWPSPRVYHPPVGAAASYGSRVALRARRGARLPVVRLRRQPHCSNYYVVRARVRFFAVIKVL